MPENDIFSDISDYNLKEMRANMDEADIEEFDKFIERNWGTQKREAIPVSATVVPEAPKRRGRPRKA